MIGSFSQSGTKTYNVNSYVIDTEADIKNLPIYCGMGSLAKVISTGDIYIFNSDKQWIKQSKGTSGGGSPPIEGDTIIYDGGVII